jgi:hypothetical protein
MAKKVAEHALELCEQHGFPMYAALSRVTMGWAERNWVKPPKAFRLSVQGWRGWPKPEFGRTSPILLRFLAEAQAVDHAIDDALITIENTLQANLEELVFRPEALRVRGELRLKQGERQLAEGDHREAIALARKIGQRRGNYARDDKPGAHGDEAPRPRRSTGSTGSTLLKLHRRLRDG